MMRSLVLAVLLAFAAIAAQAAPPAGNFALWRPGVPVSAAAAGVTVIVPWADVETAPGVFDWTAFDEGIAAAAGRPVQLAIEPGVYAPSWLYEKGAVAMTMTWGWPFGFPMCSVQRFPLPWDPAYLAAWGKMVAAFGDRYAKNPQLAAVKISGEAEAKDLESVLPTEPTAGCPKPLNPTTLWLAAGYRPALLSNSFATILDDFQAAFPGVALVLETGTWAMPGIDAAGEVTTPDWKLTTSLMQQFVTAAGKLAILQNDGLEAGPWTFHPPIQDVGLGEQAGGPITGDASCRDNGGVTPCNPPTVLAAMLAKMKLVGALFAEFYIVDINNPQLATLFEEK